jgi:hypothetical protein
MEHFTVQRPDEDGAVDRSGLVSTKYFVTYRLLTGAGRREAASMSDLHEILSGLRDAGASDITVVDRAGRLVTFDPGDHR